MAGFGAGAAEVRVGERVLSIPLSGQLQVSEGDGARIVSGDDQVHDPGPVHACRSVAQDVDSSGDVCNWLDDPEWITVRRCPAKGIPRRDVELVGLRRQRRADPGSGWASGRGRGQRGVCVVRSARVAKVCSADGHEAVDGVHRGGPRRIRGPSLERRLAALHESAACGGGQRVQPCGTDPVSGRRGRGVDVHHRVARDLPDGCHEAGHAGMRDAADGAGQESECEGGALHGDLLCAG